MDPVEIVYGVFGDARSSDLETLEQEKDTISVQGGAKVGLHLWVCETQSLFLFVRYCPIFQTHNSKPTFVPL